MNPPHIFPAEAAIWTGLVLRAPDAGWDGDRYLGSRLSGVDEGGLALITDPFRIVRNGQFLAVAAPSAAIVHRVAEALKVQWEPSVAARQKSAAIATPASMERVYAWPIKKLADPDIGEPPVAYWRAQSLYIWANCDEPQRLRRELSQLLAMDEGDISILGTAPASSPDDYDAAVDAAILSKALSRPVRVTPSRASQIANLSIRNRAFLSDPCEVERWSSTSSYPCARRPSWAAIMALADAVHITTAAPTAEADRNVYDVRVVPAPSDRILPADIALDRRSAAMAFAFARESFVDELATANSMDPVEWRLERLSDKRGRSVLEAVVRRSAWKASRDPQSRLEGKGRGFAYASVQDDSASPPQRAWSAWVVDLTVDPQNGHIAIDRITVGHHVEGMNAPGSSDANLHQQIAQATKQLLASPQTFDDWDAGVAASPALSEMTPALRIVDLDHSRVDQPPSGLSTSEALTLPAAAAVANAIFDATGIRLREPPFQGSTSPTQAAFRRKRRHGLGRALAWAGTAISAAAGVAAMALPWRPPIAPTTPDLTVYSPNAIERGRLIAAASDCVVCHTTPGGKPNAGGLALETPFGKIYSTNITPDAATGIGQWSFAAFDRAMRQGIGRDGRHLYPAFPYTSFAKFSDGDMQALYAYLMSEPAVSSATPVTKLSFPYNFRSMMAGWNLLFHDDSKFVPVDSQSAVWNRGAYLVQGAGHCGACHTPRNVLGAEKSGMRNFLAGAQIDHWDAPALNTLSSAPLLWTREDMFDYLRTGFSVRHGVAAGPMAPVIAGLRSLPDSDILAMATYLTQQESATPAGVQPKEMPRAAFGSTAEQVREGQDAHLYSLAGHGIYEGACAACHDATRGTSLFGVRPILGLNTSINSARPDNLIHVILHGITDPPSTELGYMPAFGDSLNDKQVADLVVYLRERFGNGAPPWTNVEGTVGQLRLISPEHSLVEKP